MNKHLTPIKSIRKYCLETCASGSCKEVRLCNVNNCPLFCYRMGKRPKKTLANLCFSNNYNVGDVKCL